MADLYSGPLDSAPEDVVERARREARDAGAAASYVHSYTFRSLLDAVYMLGQVRGHQQAAGYEPPETATLDTERAPLADQ